MTSKRFTNHPWDLAAQQNLRRVSGSGYEEDVDPGVNFFVLALEALGAKTHFSCEGHPVGFYVAFEAGYPLAVEIEKAGFFTVAISGRENFWTIRKLETQPSNPANGYTEADKERTLRWAAEAWLRSFGSRLGPAILQVAGASSGNFLPV